MFEGLYTISFNPNRSLAPNHILFYYGFGRRRSELRQVTKTDKMPIRKDVRKQYHSNKNYIFYGLIMHLGLTKYYN